MSYNESVTLAEETVIGGMLLDNKIIDIVHEFINPLSFQSNKNRLILIKTVELYNRDGFVDLVSLAHELCKSNAIEEVGGLESISLFFEREYDISLIAKALRIITDPEPYKLAAVIKCIIIVL